MSVFVNNKPSITSLDDSVTCSTCNGFVHNRCARKFIQNEVCGDCRKKNFGGSPKAQTPRLTDLSLQAALVEISKKLDVMYGVQTKLEQLTETDFFAVQYQQMTDFRAKADKKFTPIEQKYEKYSRALEERVMILEQREKEKNIEINGLEKENENFKEIVEKNAQNQKNFKLKM